MTDTKTKLSDEEIAARIEAAQARGAAEQSEARERAVATAATIEREGLTLAHFRRRTLTPLRHSQAHTGGVTVAYRHKKTNTFVEIATAICRDDEVFNRKLGTRTAVDQFVQGHVIRVPLYDRDVVEVVTELFDGVTISTPDRTVVVVHH